MIPLTCSKHRPKYFNKIWKKATKLIQFKLEIEFCRVGLIDNNDYCLVITYHLKLDRFFIENMILMKINSGTIEDIIQHLLDFF